MRSLIGSAWVSFFPNIHASVLHESYSFSG
jgi:hypothetical protein